MKTKALFGIALMCVLATVPPGSMAIAKEAPPLSVSVAGKVPKAGQFKLEPGTKALDALARAGVSKTKPVRLLLVRQQEKGGVEHFVLKFNVGPNSSDNIPLQERDLLIVSSERPKAESVR